MCEKNNKALQIEWNTFTLRNKSLNLNYLFDSAIESLIQLVNRQGICWTTNGFLNIFFKENN